jgi:hypothetical protein
VHHLLQNLGVCSSTNAAIYELIPTRPHQLAGFYYPSAEVGNIPWGANKHSYYKEMTYKNSFRNQHIFQNTNLQHSDKFFQNTNLQHSDKLCLTNGKTLFKTS